MCVRTFLPVFLIFLLFPVLVAAEEAAPETTISEETIPEELSPEEEPLYRLTIGLSVHSTDFDVNDSNGNIQGTLSEDLGYAPFVTLGSPYSYLSEKIDFGWYMEYGLSTFRLDRQLVNDELVDLGTSVKGYYATVTPVIFYNFGDRTLEGHSFKAGVGAGVGYLMAKGNIILTETPTQERHDFKLNDLGLAVFVLFDYRFNNFMIRTSGTGPTVDESGHEYDAIAVAIDFGYSISF